MDVVGFFIAFVCALLTPSIAGSIQSDLPGIGTFAYGGTPIASPAMVAAVR